MIVVALRDPAPDDPAPDERRVLRMRWVKTPRGLRARWELVRWSDAAIGVARVIGAEVTPPAA